MLTFGKGLEAYEKKGIKGTIGEGNYGKVKYSTHLITNQPVAEE